MGVSSVFTQFKEPITQIYEGIAGIITLVAALGFAICSIGMIIGKNQKTVEEFKAWRTRIMITWVVFFMLGVIVSLGKSITADMQFKA